MHIRDKLKYYSWIFLSAEPFWQISRLPIDLIADRIMDEAQDIIIITKYTY